MGGRWALALSAAAVAAAVSAADWIDPPADGGTGVRDGGAGEVCALRRADRARTPSRVCISCHDGSAGPAISLFARGAARDSHPVSVDYAGVVARNPDKYEPGSRLPAAVPLVEGKVECTTCHDGRSTTKNRVVEHPQLCTACHRL